MDATAALYRILLELGDDGALRALLLAELPPEARAGLMAALPSSQASYAAVAARATDLLVGRGLLGPGLLAALAKAAPERAAEIAILTGRREPVRTLLPRARDAFFGREAELDHLDARLRADAELLTLVGPHGVGKSRLALEYCRRNEAVWSGNVVYCDLLEASSLSALISALARALGAGESAGAVEELGRLLAGRGRCLVVLDGFERLVGVGEVALAQWLELASEATYLVTCVELLSLPGEELLELSPLPLSPEAVDLFASRAQARRPDFLLSPQNRDDVQQLVELLDGLPLAVEVAAARSRTLSPRQMVARLGTEDVQGSRYDPLQAAFDVSWERLTPWEKAAFAQTSVFSGPFDLDAAEAVLDLSPWASAPPVVDLISSLVNKSLLRSHAQGPDDHGPPTFSLYRSVRAYAAARLQARGGEGLGPEAEQAAKTRLLAWQARGGKPPEGAPAP